MSLDAIVEKLITSISRYLLQSYLLLLKSHLQSDSCLFNLEPNIAIFVFFYRVTDVKNFTKMKTCKNGRILTVSVFSIFGSFCE